MSRNAVAVLPQFGRVAPQAGPVVTHQGSFMGLFFRRGLAFRAPLRRLRVAANL